ncbi:S41 family peptidase [Kitasatospora sp. RG8]|uniref:S41 family peptidase n=1 Tax=Kitasatospora sp. RG8 TaxID=2820815 RepID=UPI001AE05EF8|nr:S41 family peptidase [Kitasatospora sp. RG8]MBP0452761.1 S41 family peptidase [Kitasatospora sp. RG8]
MALAVTVGAAAPVFAAPGGPGQEGRPGANRLEGVWRTDGYGAVMAISGDRLTSYDVTRSSCTPGLLSERQVGAPEPGGATRYGPPDKTFAELTVTPRGHGRAVLKADASVGTVTLERLPGLPALCRQPAADDPLAVFDRFWENFEENYPFFAAKGIDWHAVRDHYRPQVGPQTTDDRLQQIFVEMIEPLHDAHTGLARARAGGGLTPVFGGLRPGTAQPTEELRKRSAEAVAAQLLAPEVLFGGGRLGVGELPGGIGYLRVSGFDDYVDDGGYQDQAAELDRALDALLAGPARPHGLVIDVRLNGGGSDELGLRIAARLTDRPYLAYRKVARNDPDDPTRFTTPQPIPVRPAAGARHTGPVALLTAGSTVSAGETFTQALIARSPHVTRIGENTQGVFSDIMIRLLSPTFAVILPNEKFLTPDGSSFDGPGIPPDVRTPVFTPEELEGLKDSALSRARQALGGSSGT